MRNLKRTLALLMSLCMLMGLLVVPASAAEFTTLVNDPARYTDIKGHWAEEALTNALANGIMYGTTSTTASPDAPLTRAQMSTLIVRAFEATKTSNVSAFADMKSDAWYYDYMSRAVQMGIVSGNGNSMFPNSKITRQEAACVFCRAFNLYGYSYNLNQFSDGGSVAGYARDPMAACFGAGVMTAIDGKIQPTKELTRAEFTYAMYQIVQNYISTQVPFAGGNVAGSVMVTTPNITITNSSIGGNMYIGDGVENGSITLDGVQVKGTIYVRGSSKLYLNNRSTANSIVVFNPSYAVSVEIDNTSSVRNTIIDTAISGVTISGNVGDITMNTAKATLNLKGATAGRLDANVILPTITIDKDSLVQKMTIPDVADGAKINVDGKVKSLLVEADTIDYTSTKTSDVDTVEVTGDDSKFKFGGKMGDITVSGRAADNDFTFGSDSEVETFNITSSNDNNITVDSGAEMDEILFNQSKSRMSMTLKAPDVRIGSKANGSKFTFNEGTDIDELVVDGDDVTIVVSKGANIDTITVTGDNVDISGKGSVGTVVLKRGATGADISTPSTKVENNSGGTAYVGDGTVPSGSTGSTDEDGDLKGDGNNNTTNPNDPNNPNNPNKPSETNPVQSSFYLEYPSNATPNDIYGSGQYSLSDLVLNGGYNSSTQQITGTVKTVPNFAPMLSTDSTFTSMNYFPLVLRSSDRTPDFTLTVGNKTFTALDLSVGPNYGNQLIFFVELNQSDATKKVTITYDADGDGKAYTPATMNIFFAGVQFERDMSTTNRMATVTNAAGINGAESLRVSDFQAISDTSATYNLSCSNLIKTANQQGEEGYWGGVIIPGPKEAMLASYTVETNKGTQDYTTGLILEESRTYFEFYQNMEGIQYMNLRVTWKNGNSQAISAEETYNFNTMGIHISDGSEPSVTEIPIAASVSIRAASNEELQTVEGAQGKTVSEYADPFNVLSSSGDDKAGTIVGTFYPVVKGQAKAGPYAPLSITIMGLKGPAEVRYNNTRLGDIPEPSNGDYSSYNPDFTTLIPLTYIGAQIQDFTINIVPKSSDESGTGGLPSGGNAVVYTTVTKAIDASDAAYAASNIVMAKVNSGTFFGKSFDELTTSGYDLARNGTGYDFKGTYAKVTVDDSSGLTNKTGWFAPVRVTNNSDSGKTWSVTVTSPKGATGETDVKTYNADASTRSIDLAIPLGYYNTDDDCNFYNRVQVLVKDAGNNTLETFYIDAKSTTMTGLPTTKAEGSGIGLGTVETPVTVTLTKAANTATIGALKYSDLVASDYTLTANGANKFAVAGQFKKATVSTGTDGWAAPITVTLSKALSSKGTIEVVYGGATPAVVDIAAGETTATFVVPLGVAVDSADKDTAYTTATVTVKDGSSKVIGSFTLTSDAANLEGFKVKEDVPNPGPSDEVEVSIAKSANDSTVEGHAYANLVTEGYTLTPGTDAEADTITIDGKFKKVTTLFDGTDDGWAAPVTLTLSKELGAAGSVTLMYGDVEGTPIEIGATVKEISFLVPLGRAVADHTEHADTVYNSITVTVKNADGDVLKTYTFQFELGTPVNLEGFVENPSLGSGGEDEDFG